MKLKEL
jgi:uncharacterized protein YhbP (UPF0306 family)